MVAVSGLWTVRLVAVFVAICAAILPQVTGFLWGLGAIGLLSATFCALSLVLGYAVPRLVRIGHGQAVAAAFEIGVHNSVLAITVAAYVLASSASPAVDGGRRPGPRRGARARRESD